jgi:hypothetical protein
LKSTINENKKSFLNHQKTKLIMNLINDEKAQVSVELIIVLAAVVAVVLVLVSQIQNTSTEGSKKIEKTAKEVFSKIDKI